ncbi:MAG: RNA pseudouridine synthase [Hydrogenophilales bacterium 28-61-23]|nr:MAG: RNA pseudouridine synthase [Hydrogenophilales bacterium 28-61-23]
MLYTPPPAGDVPFELLYVDDHLLVLNKPSGLLSVPGRGPDKQDCLSARAQRRYPDALIVHRLDMQTSGLLAMARGIEAQRALNRAFEQRQVHKRYQAVVDGIARVIGPEEWGVIDLPLELDWPNRPKHIVDYQHGRPSVTRWRVLSPDRERNGTRLELEPITGRSHQLRVHLQAIGHPILGDDLYASADAVARADRLLLHACELNLPHPATGELISFSSPPPF